MNRELYDISKEKQKEKLVRKGKEERWLTKDLGNTQA